MPIFSSADFHEEIEAGQPVIKLLKDYFFADNKWDPKVAWKIGCLLGEVKRKAKIFFPEKDMIYALHQLSTFSKEDFQDILKKEEKK